MAFSLFEKLRSVLGSHKSCLVYGNNDKHLFPCLQRELFPVGFPSIFSKALNPAHSEDENQEESESSQSSMSELSDYDEDFDFVDEHSKRKKFLSRSFICNKEKNALGDSHLDALCFLKSLFKKIANK
ncbi:CLUMA_CG002815, isoform A [Clunio marinus]|uniref:CLUMA_CG002815, isoform A n=1 Tax=Clunio marinus TaxID=568069 RepID=A0A1J1HMW3_9DIPT|nr:CLUMA_CG002815, isoform A [Clunio marinus]